ncbi:MAG: lycopene beta-cyclase CrtY [Erythrobacter sp.]
MAMKADQVDIAIVGGGLAGGLIALAVHQADPELRIALIEKGETFGGNHRWSWFASDLDDAGAALMAEFEQSKWDAGYDVRFVQHARTLTTGYRSLTSDDFHSALTELLPDDAVRLNASAASLDEDGVTLQSDELFAPRIDAKIVIDCRPFEPSEHLTGGWQIFMGRRMRLIKPHGMTRPIIMDADVNQLSPDGGNGGAFRFLYSLPVSDDEVFVEDTYYADEPRIDRDMLSSRIDSYCHVAGWQGEEVDRETGILPVITGGDFDAYLDSIRIPGVAIAGARGGFSHPLTSYTVPIAVENALAIAGTIARRLENNEIAEFVEFRAQSHWKATNFYRMLGKMLFGAADPHKRDTIFAQFYRRPQALVERFYRAQTTWGDKLRILTGKPPVAISRAIRALTLRGNPLKAPAKPKQTDTGETA